MTVGSFEWVTLAVCSSCRFSSERRARLCEKSEWAAVVEAEIVEARTMIVVVVAVVAETLSREESMTT